MSLNLVGYYQSVDQLQNCCNCSLNVLYNVLGSYGKLSFESDEQDMYSKPMLWIGIYIAVASLFCILPMVADLLHGFRNRMLWFPCKYFTMNAASLTVIAVATKLPMDLNNSMPGNVDQSAKLGSMAFTCTMMANLLPSLATMDSKELLTNIIALGVLEITLVVNVCIQINTGVVSSGESPTRHFVGDSTYFERYNISSIAIIYVGMLLMMLIIHICSSLAILKSKQILESKYQSCHRKDQELLQQEERLIVEKLKQHVSNYWTMAGTGSPQFMTACSATSIASGVICALSTVLHILLMLFVCSDVMDYASDYEWSVLVILITQFVGVVLGSIAPISRCFASLSFKMSVKWIWNHITVFKVETYWTQKISDWKQSSLPFTFRSRKSKIFIHKLKVLILDFCVGVQKGVVVVCKVIGLVPISIVICAFHCSKWSKAMSKSLGIVLGKRSEQQEQDQNLSPYVLQVQDDMEISERTLKSITKSVNRLIKKAEKQQPNNLMNLLEKSKGFEGVEKYDSRHVLPLLGEGFLDCWSLPLVTLTTVAISLPDIQNDIVDSLLSSVSEGLVYVKVVEESFNATGDYIISQKAAKTLWIEVDVYHKWLGNKLQKPFPQVNTAQKILEWFRDTAKNMVIEVEGMDIGGRNDDSIWRSISANSMYRIAETILLSYQSNIEEVSQEELFEQLSSMISDILVACLTNLPQVIARKCHTSVIEKREASVHAAAQLLGETMQIINSLEDRELPSLNPGEMAFIDKWHAYFQPPLP